MGRNAQVAWNTANELISVIPESMRPALGNSPSVALNNAQRARTEFDKLSAELKQYGLSIPEPKIVSMRGGKNNSIIYYSDNPVTLADIMQQLAERKAAATAPIEVAEVEAVPEVDLPVIQVSAPAQSDNPKFIAKWEDHFDSISTSPKYTAQWFSWEN